MKLDVTATEESADIYLNPDAPKRVIVEMDFRIPKYTFEGPWTGRDINIVRGNLHRAYRQRQMGLRNATATPEPQPSLENTEVTK